MSVNIWDNPEEFQDGDGKPCTQEDAVKILEILAQDNYAPAQYNLGNIYSEGRFNDIVDYDKAIQYYKAAVEQDFPSARTELGVMVSEWFRGTTG